MRKTGAILTLSVSLCVAACSSGARYDGDSKVDPATGSIAPGNKQEKPYINRGLNSGLITETSRDAKSGPRTKRGRRGRKKPRPKPTPTPTPIPTPKHAPYKGGAYSETHQTVSTRGPQIVLPNVFNSVVTNLDKPLPKKKKVACVVVEGSYLRKEKTRGICKILRNQSSPPEVVSWDSLKQSQTLNSLLTLARSQNVDLIVILEKRQERSFVILDARNAAVLCHTTRSQENLVSGDNQLIQLHGKICKAWTAQ